MESNESGLHALPVTDLYDNFLEEFDRVAGNIGLIDATLESPLSLESNRPNIQVAVDAAEDALNEAKSLCAEIYGRVDIKVDGKASAPAVQGKLTAPGIDSVLDSLRSASGILECLTVSFTSTRAELDPTRASEAAACAQTLVEKAHAALAGKTLTHHGGEQIEKGEIVSPEKVDRVALTHGLNLLDKLHLSMDESENPGEHVAAVDLFRVIEVLQEANLYALRVKGGAEHGEEEG